MNILIETVRIQFRQPIWCRECHSKAYSEIQTLDDLPYNHTPDMLAGRLNNLPPPSGHYIPTGWRINGRGHYVCSRCTNPETPV